MKRTITQSIGALMFAASLLTVDTALAQRVEATKTTTTSEGTVSEFGPQSISIKTQTDTQPVSYIYSGTTNYVDEDGNPVGVTTVKSGLPVTVYYTRVGDALVASRVIVRKAVLVPIPLVEQKTTTTTKTTRNK